MRAVRWIIPFVALATATPLLAQVFGINGDKQPGDYQGKLDRRDGPYDWHTIRPPAPDAQFIRYETNSIPGLGICRVSAITRSFKPDETAALLAASNRLHRQLNELYGTSKSYADPGKPTDYWIGKAEAPSGQFDDPGALITFWLPKVGSVMPAGLESVALLVMPDEGQNTRSITVIYSFPKNDECVARYKAAKRK